MAFDVREEIKRKINGENDPKWRNMLMLMDAQCDHTEEVMRAGTDAVLQSINQLREDEDALRKLVLNGDAETHHIEHQEIRDHLKFSEANQALIERAKLLVPFVEELMLEREAALATRKSLVHKMLEGAASQIGTIFVTAAASVFAAMHFMKG